MSASSCHGVSRRIMTQGNTDFREKDKLFACEFSPTIVPGELMGLNESTACRMAHGDKLNLTRWNN